MHAASIWNKGESIRWGTGVTDARAQALGLTGGCWSCQPDIPTRQLLHLIAYLSVILRALGLISRIMLLLLVRLLRGLRGVRLIFHALAERSEHLFRGHFEGGLETCWSRDGIAADHIRAVSLLAVR